MKKFIYLLIVALICDLSDSYSQVNYVEKQVLSWNTDLEKAIDSSKASGKPIFAFFTGSDWCGWCKALQRNVFEKPKFKEWANEHVILLEVDFPRKKQLAPALVQQNNHLQQFFQVTSFPTIWIFYVSKDDVEKQINISSLGKLGYPQNAEQGNEELKFISDANLILANNNPPPSPAPPAK